MSTYAPWMNPAQHPYLANPYRPSLKRKHSYYTSTSSDLPSAGASSTDYSPTSDASDLPVLVDSANTTIDASQTRHHPKRRRYDSALGVEGDFDHLALEQKLREQKVEAEVNSGRETRAERQERFWELDGELEVDMGNLSHSPSSVMYPAAVESPAEHRSASEPIAAGRNWFEAEKDRIVITSLDSDSDSAKSTPPQNALTLENGELVSTAVVSALRGSASLSAFGGGRSALFDNRRWGDLTPLERMTAGMAGATPLAPVRDEEMADATEMGQFEEPGMAMDVEM